MIRLRTNFADYYDPWCGREGPVVDRMGTEGWGKKEQFLILEKAGWRCVPHGPLHLLQDGWWPEEKQWHRDFVVYDDEMAHTGDGKRVVSSADLQRRYGGRQIGCRLAWLDGHLFASVFLGKPHRRPSVSWRYLHLGVHAFWLEYTSTEDWRSNCGDGGCHVIGVERDVGPHPTIPLPLFAVDFVLGKEMWAVDFNTAPGVRGSGVEGKLRGPEAVASLAEWFRLQPAVNGLQV